MSRGSSPPWSGWASPPSPPQTSTRYEFDRFSLGPSYPTACIQYQNFHSKMKKKGGFISSNFSKSNKHLGLVLTCVSGIILELRLLCGSVSNRRSLDSAFPVGASDYSWVCWLARWHVNLVPFCLNRYCLLDAAYASIQFRNRKIHLSNLLLLWDVTPLASMVNAIQMT